MNSEIIDNYRRQIWIESHEIEDEIRKILKEQGYEDQEALAMCLNFIRRLRETLCDSADFLGSFMDGKEFGEVSQRTVDWSEITLKDFYKLEYGLLDMHVSYTGDPDKVGDIIRTNMESAPGMVTIDLDIVLPHKKHSGLRSSSMLSLLLDESFRIQVGEVDEENKFERAYIIIELHENRSTEERIKRDCDNYDTKHLIDVAARHFLKHGDGPDYMRVCEAVIPDDHPFTRICIVSPEHLKDYGARENGFFHW